MYRCQCCNRLSELRQPRIIHTIHRRVKKRVRVVIGYKISYTGQQVAQYGDEDMMCTEPAVELAVCRQCGADLQEGRTVQQLRMAAASRFKPTHAPDYKMGPTRKKLIPVPEVGFHHCEVNRQLKQQKREERLAAMEGKIVTR